LITETLAAQKMSKQRLSSRQRDRLADFAVNVAVVILATVLVPALTGSDMTLLIAAQAVGLTLVALVISLALSA